MFVYFNPQQIYMRQKGYIFTGKELDPNLMQYASNILDEITYKR